MFGCFRYAIGHESTAGLPLVGQANDDDCTLQAITLLLMIASRPERPSGACPTEFRIANCSQHLLLKYCRFVLDR